MAEPIFTVSALGYGALAAAAAAGLVASDAPEEFLRGARDAGRDFARGLERIYFPTAYEVYDIAARNAALDRYVDDLNAANALRRDLAKWVTPPSSGGGGGPRITAAAAVLTGGLALWSLRDRPAVSPVNVGDPKDTGDFDASDAHSESHVINHIGEIYFMAQEICDEALAGLAVEAAQELRQLNQTTLSLLYYRARSAFKSAVAFFLVGGGTIPLQCNLRNPLPPESCWTLTMLGNLLGLLKEAADKNMHPARLVDFQGIQANILQSIGGSFGDFEILMRRPSNSPGFFKDANACLSDHIRKLLCQN